MVEERASNHVDPTRECEAPSAASCGDFQGLAQVSHRILHQAAEDGDGDDDGDGDGDDDGDGDGDDEFHPPKPGFSWKRALWADAIVPSYSFET
ncbi:uncharacterized protein BBA_04672 [Beauveria bassiana ARSEF 2860]|uniref:Uncharacterized protein n=1 Tax=Beauveria bassiana (strain ARSEF 2860) TaxID=655819 RepID=J4KNR8_BEAB2|nr:uncharacterized protein BBA_04672 [Beauveria bassiana ARSEF 2860]EJP66179.1 hypothetical protein BBA_04672 [Beauveria bassiana ARSEF 2860]